VNKIVKTREIIITRSDEALKKIPWDEATDQEKVDAKHYNEIEITLKIKSQKLKNINYDLKTQYKQLDDYFNRFLLREEIVTIPSTPTRKPQGLEIDPTLDI